MTNEIKFKVTATNGEITRTEDIYSDNEIFEECETEEEVKNLYEDFWGGEVKVIQVEIIDY